MSYLPTGEGALDYLPCRYGKSKLLFRGPRRRLEGAYCAVLGGTETYGRFIETPYPALVEPMLRMPVVNFGCLNAGADVFLGDASIMDACGKARVTVVQVMGAQNMSNRFYAVHPRRNDRFLRASSLMKTLFREVDFTEFHFNRHMLATLRDRTPDKYGILTDELKSAWVARMKLLLERIGGRTVLLWITAPEQRADGAMPLGDDPLLIDRDMVAQLHGHATDLIRIDLPAQGVAGKVFAPMEEAAALPLPGPEAHRSIAMALTPMLKKLA